MDLKDLAVNGGPKAVQKLPDRFHFGQEEKAAVAALIDKLSERGGCPGYNGAEENAFCREFADFLGGGYADGTNSGTNSVYVALKSLHLPPFSEVVTGCITDAGGAMPVVLNDCIPVPADTAPGSFMPGPEEIEARITERTSAILVAHIFGDPADMPGIMRVAEKHHLPVVEDCAQAHMARIHGRNVGTFGEVGSFSLMFGKHFCAGGQGGAVFTRSEERYNEVLRSADRGKPFGAPAGSSNLFPALNCNMDEIHAVIARVQLKKLPDIVRRRQEAVNWLWTHGLEKLPEISCPQRNLPAGFESCFWRMRVEFHPETMKCSMMEYQAALAAEGVVAMDYHFAVPFNQGWYTNRRDSFPWNTPQYSRFNQDYALPNMQKTLDSQFIVFILESYGPAELKLIVDAFAKLHEAFSK